MRSVQVSKKIINLLESGHQTISRQDVGEFYERCTPGEWVIINGERNAYLVYVNPHAHGGVMIKLCDNYSSFEDLSDPKDYIIRKLKEAIDYRYLVLGRNLNCRLFYGAVDGVPGLTIDSYQNYTIIEIGTLGCWVYRNEIKSWIEAKFPKQKTLLRNKSSQWEELPEEENSFPQDNIHIMDNEIKTTVHISKMQKIGYYFDHSRNRKKLASLISEFSSNGITFQTGLDLFCYVGSWGLTLLRAGLNEVDFVDQGDFAENISENISINSLENKGKFFRSDVFSYLEKAQRDEKKYDIIISDPPAMTKRPDQKTQSLRGYSKVHLGCLKLARKGTIFIAASCTSYISNEELDLTVAVSAQKLSLKVRLLDIGIQEWDHPVRGLKAEENYIKYLCYIVL